MNKFSLLSVLALVISLTAISQDIIFKKDGTQIKAKVLEIMSEVVKYKKFTNPDGPIYEVKKIDLLKIVYPDGSIDDFSKETLTTTQNQVNALQELMKASVRSGFKANGKSALKLNGADYTTEYNQLTVAEVGRQVGVVLKNKSAVMLMLTSTIVTPDKRIVISFTLTENEMKPATFKPTSLGGNEFERINKRFIVSVSYINPDANMGVGGGNNIPINNIKKGEFIIESIDTSKRSITGTYRVMGSTVDGGKIELEGSLTGITY